MKKIMMLLMVAVLMLGVSGQAMASFEQGHLIRVVYNNTAAGLGNEYATDLGAYAPTSLDGTNFHNTIDTFSLSSVGASNWSQVNIAYFIVDYNAAAEGRGGAWASGPAAGNTANLYAYWGGFAGAATTTAGGYEQAAAGAKSVTMSQTSALSYWNNMNNGGTMIGSMGQYITPQNGETSLGALATSNYVDQVLYYYGSDPDAGNAGVKVGTLRTFANGSTALNPVPIPAAVYLFGSGLLGLVGLRRKMAA